MTANFMSYLMYALFKIFPIVAVGVVIYMLFFGTRKTVDKIINKTDAVLSYATYASKRMSKAAKKVGKAFFHSKKAYNAI